MKNKKKVQYSWQALLLCIFVSVSYLALAKLSSASSTEKHNPRKPTNAKKKPPASATKGSSVSTPIRPTSQRQQRVQKEKKLKQDQPSVSISREKYQPVSRASDKSAVNSRTKKKRSTVASDRAKARYVTVLKETKRHTMEKTVVALPVSRTEARNHRWKEKKISLRKSPPSTARKTRLIATKSQSSRMYVLRSTQPSSPLASTTQEERVQSATAVQSPPPSSPPTVALVERVPPTIMLKDESRTKEWSGYTPQRAPFTVTFNDDQLGRRINSAFVLPRDEIFLAVNDPQRKGEYTLHSSLGPERLLASRRWYWTAPADTGLYPVKITNTRTGSSVTLNVFVMVPLDRIQDGHLNGYRIGQYPTEALRKLPMYNPPRGLIEVTPENENILVSPHFRLRQFLCKQDGDYPKYMILDARLLATLEQLLEMVNAHGYRARTFSIMSGYRTPYYNRAIGNRTTYSRHLWGDAADIFIDEEPYDGEMDDLNQDGVIDTHDADVIYQLIENVSEPRLQKILMGGLARYRETSSHGPFIHVDARGSNVRWGIRTLTKGGSTPAETAFQVRDSQPSFLDTQSATEPAP